MIRIGPEHLIGVFDSNNRGNKIEEPLETADIYFDNILKCKDSGLSQPFYEFKNLVSLVYLAASNIVKKKKTFILTESTGRDLFVCSLASSLPKTKLILRLRGDSFEERERKNLQDDGLIKYLESRLNQYLDIKSMKKCDLILPVSDWLSKSIKRKTDLHDNKLRKIPTPQLKDIKYKKSHSANNLKILAVTNFVFHKKVHGLTKFLEEYEIFLDKNDLKIDIAGSGHLEDKLRQKKNSKILGYIKEIESTYQDYDVLIHFSYLDAYPSVVLEAQAAKLPVVVNNCCGMKEQVEDGETGLIVDLDNKEETKNKIEKLIDDKKLRERLGQNGHDKVMRENSKEKIGRDLKEAIEELSQEIT